MDEVILEKDTILDDLTDVVAVVHDRQKGCGR
jgi:hypothetical protein